MVNSKCTLSATANISNMSASEATTVSRKARSVHAMLGVSAPQSSHAHAFRVFACCAMFMLTVDAAYDGNAKLLAKIMGRRKHMGLEGPSNYLSRRSGGKLIEISYPEKQSVVNEDGERVDSAYTLYAPCLFQWDELHGKAFYYMKESGLDHGYEYIIHDMYKDCCAEDNIPQGENASDWHWKFNIKTETRFLANKTNDLPYKEHIAKLEAQDEERQAHNKQAHEYHERSMNRQVGMDMRLAQARKQEQEEALRLEAAKKQARIQEIDQDNIVKIVGPSDEDKITNAGYECLGWMPNAFFINTFGKEFKNAEGDSRYTRKDADHDGDFKECDAAGTFLELK